MEKVDIGTRYDLPQEVRFCKRCVMSNQRPRIVFNDEGICYACLYSDHKHNNIDWESRENELIELCDKHRSRNGSYDVIVPSSGGKDSSIVAHQLKFQYGMHPLTVTWSPNIYTAIGWDNFQGLIRSGLDNVMGSPNGGALRKLMKAATIELGDPFQPFIYGQYNFPMRVAVEKGIKLIFGGENTEAEYSGNPEAWDVKAHSVDDLDRLFFSNIGLNTWLEKGFTSQELALFLAPDIAILREMGISRQFYGYYKKWIPQENFYYAAKNTNFKSNPDGRSEGTYSKYASLDDQIDGFHYYFMLLKFGIGRATSDAAHEVRDGHITREEAVALIRRYDTEFPAKYFQVFLDFLDINESEFWGMCERWRNDNLWEKKGNDWTLKTQVE